MKRSRAITLTLLTGAALTVSGCNEEEPAKFFNSSASCVNELKTPEACAEAEKTAMVEHLQTAPKFTSKEQCEAEFGAENCVNPVQQTSTAHSGGGYFMPLMMGYMMGRSGGFFGGNNYAAQPMYRDRNNNAFTGGNRNTAAGVFSGNRFQPNAAFSANGMRSAPRVAPASTVNRGGFGSSSRTRSVWS